ncbi:MAG: hypothetical protein AAB508_06205 [Patescibacteria group bacterium]
MLNGSDWVKILEHIRVAIAFLALNDKVEAEEVTKLVEQYAKGILDDRDNIFALTAAGIVEYINFYKVHPKDGVYDEFKSIYFTGMAVSKRLAQLGLVDLNKLHLRAMLRLLDLRLEEPFKVRRTALTERIRSIIDNNVIESHLGKYGWYLIYKCLYNAANTKSETI